MRGTGMTRIVLGNGQQLCLFVAVDHRSASREGQARGHNRSAKGVLFECFGAIGEGVATGLSIRHDKGSQSIGRGFFWRDRLGVISGVLSPG